MAIPDRPGGMPVAVVWSPHAGCVDEVDLMLPEGSTLGDALRASGLADRHPDLDLASATTGVWGRPRSLDHVLRTRDRVEVYRPLQVDPKEARRLRLRGQKRR